MGVGVCLAFEMQQYGMVVNWEINEVVISKTVVKCERHVEKEMVGMNSGGIFI